MYKSSPADQDSRADRLLYVRPDGRRTWEVLCIFGDGGFSEVSGVPHAVATIAALQAVNDPQHCCYGAPIEFERRKCAEKSDDDADAKI